MAAPSSGVAPSGGAGAAVASKDGAAVLDGYEILSSIGKGSFGNVSKVRRKADGRILVWKELNYGSMREKEKQLVVSEVRIREAIGFQMFHTLPEVLGSYTLNDID
jgi:serine/threonine protein kinase